MMMEDGRGIGREGRVCVPTTNFTGEVCRVSCLVNTALDMTPDGMNWVTLVHKCSNAPVIYIHSCGHWECAMLRGLWGQDGL